MQQMFVGLYTSSSALLLCFGVFRLVLIKSVQLILSVHIMSILLLVHFIYELVFHYVLPFEFLVLFLIALRVIKEPAKDVKAFLVVSRVTAPDLLRFVVVDGVQKRSFPLCLFSVGG